MAKGTEVAIKKTAAEIATIAGSVDMNSPEDMKALLQAAKGAETAAFEVVSSEYKKLNLGETYIFLCHGLLKGAMQDLQDETKLNDAVSLVDEEGVTCINSDVVFVSTVRREEAAGKPFPCIYRVYVDERTRGAKGAEYKDLRIERLRAK